MAATRLIALHKNKGKSVATCLKSRTDYAQNPEKTKQGELVSSYECSPLTVDEEFMLSKRQYELATGRRQKSDVIAYQIRQSFKPGEITAEEANKVGYELAMRFTKGKYAFIIATHTDREHIHNHIIYNSTALDSTRKFRDFLLSGLAVQRLSDLICLEHLHGLLYPALRALLHFQQVRMQSSRQEHRVVQYRAMLHQVSPAQSPVLAQCFLLLGQGQVRKQIISDFRVGHVPAVHIHMPCGTLRPMRRFLLRAGRSA